MQERFRTNISKAKGLGSAHDGVHHWLAQRFSSVLVTLIMIWMVCLIICVVGKPFSEVIEIIKKPYNVLAVCLFAISSFYHANLGMQVIIEDYVRCRAMRLFFLYSTQLISIITTSAVVVAMLYLMTL